jgi:hypothetical protein
MHIRAVSNMADAAQMTTCTPLKPFRCWHYSADSLYSIPEWAAEMCRVLERQPSQPEDGWIVEIDEVDRLCHWYSTVEFEDRFEITP